MKPLLRLDDQVAVVTNIDDPEVRRRMVEDLDIFPMLGRGERSGSERR